MVSELFDKFSARDKVEQAIQSIKLFEKFEKDKKEKAEAAEKKRKEEEERRQAHIRSQQGANYDDVVVTGGKTRKEKDEEGWAGAIVLD